METQVLLDAIEETGYEWREYSGRGMSGAQCVGVVFQNNNELCDFMVSVAQGHLGEIANAVAAGVRFDDMGKDMIAYWPRCKINKAAA
jgi:hypothetical protein